MKLYLLAATYIIASFGLTASADESARIGAIYAMSGNVAQYGNWAFRGAQLAQFESEYPLQLLLEDSGGEGAKGVSAYQKLRAVDHVSVVSTLISSVALAVKPLAARDKIVQMDISATAPSYGTTDGYQFRTGINALQLATASADYIANVRGLPQVGCFYIENEFGQGMFDVFRMSFSGKIPAMQTFRPGDTDFRTQILKLKSSGVPAVWLVGHARESGLIIAQARQLGYHVPFISDVYSIETPDFLAGIKDPGDLTYLAPKFDPKSSEPAVRGFVEKYHAKFGETPTVYAAQAYDGLLAIGKALKKCGGPVPDCMPIELRKVDFPGASGQIKFDSDGNVKKKLEIKIVANGQFVTKSEYNNKMEPTTGAARRGSS